MPDWDRYVRERLPLRLRPEREAEIVRELAQQLEQAYNELIAAGVPPEEAAQRADAQAGDWRALARDITSAEAQPSLPDPPPPALNLFGGLRQDILYAIRFLRKKPAFALIAAGTLAFGIGANTSMFTLVDTVVLRGLPYPDSSRLVTLGAHRANQTDIAVFTSAPDFFDLRRMAKSFSAVAAVSPVWNMVTTGAEQADRLECLFVSSNFFPLTGASPALGRTFTDAEDRTTSGAKVLLLGHAYWQRKYGGSTDVLNKPLALDGVLYTIIGVMPEGFRYMGEPMTTLVGDIDVWLPMAANPLISTPRNLRFMKVLAHLAPGITVEQARGEVQRIRAQLAEQYPASNREMAWELRPLREEVFGKYRTPMLLLLGAVGFVLLLACANVANLLLGRVAERQQEMSIRTALGASGFRILRQLLAESLVLATLGGALGVAMAFLVLKVLVAVGPQSLMRNQAARLDLRALAFTAAVVLITAILAGLAPALRTVSPNIGGALRTSGRSLTSGTHRFRSGLVIAQVAIALVLLVGAGLLILSFRNLLQVDPGFRAENLATIATQVPMTERSPEQRTAVYRTLREQLLAVPGVEQVAAVSRLPMSAADLTSLLQAEGQPMGNGQGVEVQYRRSTPDFFQTMGIPLLRGRVFDEHDSPLVALVDETTARMVWPGEDAVGKRVKLGGSTNETPWTTILGVVGATRNFGLDVAASPTLYVPYAAVPLNSPILMIRTSRNPSPMLNELTATVRRTYKGMPAYNVYSMDMLVERSTSQRRFVMLLLTAFAAAAMLLAAVGVYGSISHTVAQRKREIGLRMALGASPMTALRMVLFEGMRLTAAGVAIGIAAAAGLTRVMESSLFGVRALDPLAFAAAAVVLAAFAVLACAAPALRATHVDPLVALREE